MKTIKVIQKYSFLILGISLSLPIALQSKVIFLFICVQIILAFFNRRRISRNGIVIPLLFVALFLLGLISLSYSTNQQFGLNKIITQLSLLFIPIIVIIYGRDQIGKYAPNFYRGIIVGNLFLILYISFGLLKAILISDLDFVSSNSIRLLNDILHGYNHRTYIGIALVAGYISTRSIFNTPDAKYYHVIGILYAVLVWAIIFLLGVRSIILIYSIILILQIWMSPDNKKSILISVFFIFGFALLFSFHPRLSKYVTLESTSTNEVFRSNVRHDLWTAAWELIESKPVFGYGLGDGKGELVESISHLESIKQLQFNPDAHNQFIQSWLDSGVVSTILILGILLVFIIVNKKTPPLMRFGLPLLFLFAMMFEVILHRLSGVILFTTLFTIPPEKVNASNARFKIFSVVVTIASLFLIIFGILSQTLIDFRPTEPSSYMSLNHSEIEYQDLPGNIPINIPTETKGCLLNKNSFEKQLNGNLYAQAIINERNVRNGDSIILSAYYYIDEKFNGTEVRISGREQIQEPNDRYANLNVREQWQYLTINTTAVKGKALFVVTIGKLNTIVQDSIAGEVIFAYPQLRIIKGN